MNRLKNKPKHTHTHTQKREHTRTHTLGWTHTHTQRSHFLQTVLFSTPLLHPPYPSGQTCLLDTSLKDKRTHTAWGQTTRGNNKDWLPLDLFSLLHHSGGLKTVQMHQSTLVKASSSHPWLWMLIINEWKHHCNDFLKCLQYLNLKCVSSIQTAQYSELGTGAEAEAGAGAGF